MLKQCDYCGNEFTARTARAKYCSDNCRVYASRKGASAPSKPAVKADVSSEDTTLISREIKLIHQKLDFLIDQSEALSNGLTTLQSAKTSPAGSDSKWKKVEPTREEGPRGVEGPKGTPGLRLRPYEAEIDGIRKTLSELEEDLMNCQDQDEADQIQERMDKLQNAKSRLLIRQNDEESQND